MKNHIENAVCTVLGALMIAAPFVVHVIRTGGLQ